MNQPKDEKELFAPIPSITAAPPADAGQDEEPKKKPAPRPDKPDHYYLMLDGEMDNIYNTAADAIKALKNTPMHSGDDVYLQDDEGKRMASKRLADVPFERGTTSAVANPNPRKEVVLELSDEMRHDLEAEGFDADRATDIEQQIEELAEAKIEKQAGTWREALERDTTDTSQDKGKAPDAGQKQATSSSLGDAFGQLRAANSALQTLRDSVVAEKGEPEWRRLLKEASDDVSAGLNSSTADQARDVPAWRLQLQKDDQAQQPTQQPDAGNTHNTAGPDTH